MFKKRDINMPGEGGWGKEYPLNTLFAVLTQAT